jgi:glycerate dehydrogenase
MHAMKLETRTPVTARLRAVFLDYASLNPADLDISALRALPLDLILHDSSPARDTTNRLQNATIAITNKVVIDADVMAKCPQLGFIAVTATGTNNIDMSAAAAHGIRVANVTAYGTQAVAQHTFALLLALSNRLREYTRDATNGRWSRSASFCLSDYPLHDLAGSTLGIIGYGELGRAVARLAEAFGMQILIAEGEGGPQAGRTPLPEVLAGSDVISLHGLLTARTEKIINAHTLAQMKRGALLINTARGGLVDEVALACALRSGQLGGAGLDVLAVEPPPADHPLLAADIPNLLITPHCAWVSRAARQRLLDTTVENIRHFIAG